MSSRKLVYLATEDWYFCLHRLVMARAARDAGWEVIVATRVDRHGGQIRAEGFELVPLPWSRGAGGWLGEFKALGVFFRLLRREKPRLVHSIALKSIVYGGLMARLAGVPFRIATVAGLGFVFSSARLKAKLLRPVLTVLLRLATSGGQSVVTLENPDDGVLLGRIGAVAPARMILVKGSGVDIHRFQPKPEPDGVPVIAMACRLLRGKGVGVAVDAARLLRSNGIPFRFLLAGSTDPDSPESFRDDEVHAWVSEGLIEWLGWIDDVAGFWQGCHIVVYPSSYGEGVPRTSLEAMACGKPLVTTDMPGCRETVAEGVNGFLVPPHDAAAVADRLAQLLSDPALRQRMGRASRDKAVAEFSEERFVAETLDVYERAILPPR